jgi:hypothetical protein
MPTEPSNHAPSEPRRDSNGVQRSLRIGAAAVGLILVAAVGLLSWTVYRQRAALLKLQRAIASPDQNQESEDASWVGLYSSPKEISGFSGTALAIEKGYYGGLQYRMTFYSDVGSSDDIDEAVKSGDVLVDGDKLYLPRAGGQYRDGKAVLSADIDRYSRREICRRTVLLRDDALKAFTQENMLYDYGILIKIADSVERFASLDDARHESIKVLYDDPAKSWNDPFVNGPNER